MSRLPIDIGSAINAGDGEALRNAFAKINQMTAEIYSILTVNGIDPTFIPGQAINNARMAQMAPGTIKANLGGGSAVPSDVSAAALANALGLNAFPLFSQDIINGNFEVWQRGTSFTADGAYTADRWKMSATTGTVTTSRQVPSAGDAIAGQEIVNYLRQAISGQSAGATAVAAIEQRIESVRAFAGQQITFSFYARRSSGSGNVAVEFIQNFGSGGSPSAAVTSLGVTSIALTSSWARYSVTVTLPSSAGKTFGTTDDGYLSVKIWTSAGTNFNGNTGSLGVQTITVDLWGAKIDRGAFATSFIQRPRALELAMCQRYYCRSAAGQDEYQIYGAPGATYAGSQSYYYPVEMRISPTLNLNFTTTNFGTGTITRQHSRGYILTATASSGTNVNLVWTWTADAEL